MSALIWSPFPDEETAANVAKALLDEKLIACANLLGTVRSLYEWGGTRGEAHETGVLFKTDAKLLQAAVARIEQLHPYDTPAVLGWHCDESGTSTAEWLGSLTPS